VDVVVQTVAILHNAPSTVLTHGHQPNDLGHQLAHNQPPAFTSDEPRWSVVVEGGLEGGLEGGAGTHRQAGPGPGPGPHAQRQRPRSAHLSKPQVRKAPRSLGTTASLSLSTVALDKALDKTPPPSPLS